MKLRSEKGCLAYDILYPFFVQNAVIGTCCLFFPLKIGALKNQNVWEMLEIFNRSLQ